MGCFQKSIAFFVLLNRNYVVLFFIISVINETGGTGLHSDFTVVKSTSFKPTFYVSLYCFSFKLIKLV